MDRSKKHKETGTIKLPKVGLIFSQLQQVDMPALDKMVLEERSSASSLKKGKKESKENLKIERQ